MMCNFVVTTAIDGLMFRVHATVMNRIDDCNLALLWLRSNLRKDSTSCYRPVLVSSMK